MDHARWCKSPEALIYESMRRARSMATLADNDRTDSLVYSTDMDWNSSDAL